MSDALNELAEFDRWANEHFTQDAIEDGLTLLSGLTQGLTLTGDQKKALDELVYWWQNPGRRPRQFITLGGYAGTGKTTLVAQLCRALNALDGVDVRVHFCAFTAKAASVLRTSLQNQGLEVNDGRKLPGGKSKKGYPVTTIHGLLYAPLELVYCKRSGELLGCADGDEPRAQVCESPDCSVLMDQTRGTGRAVVCPPRSEIHWDRKMGGPAADLVVLDEASMVSKEAWEDILSLGLPVLAIGDHGQLPPVKSAFALLSEGVDLELKEITRQGKDSAIIGLASDIRLGKPAMHGSVAYGVRDARQESYVAKINQSAMNTLPTSLGDGTDPVWICGYNRTRATWNGILRAQKGLSGPVSAGDRVICLKNTLTTYNGQLARVLSVAEVSGRFGVVELELEPEDPAEREALGGAPLVVQVPLEQFGRDKTMTTDELNMGGYKGCGLWDFGYVITCHKSQGSTFSNVIVLEERLPGGGNDHRRWLYTAVTRAKHSVVIIK
jgi:hypothetical protein